jgi:hypothetical protein
MLGLIQLKSIDWDALLVSPVMFPAIIVVVVLAVDESLRSIPEKVSHAVAAADE